MIAQALLAWYERHGRKELPWRVVREPYYTLVSEFMLQQTQVDRVVPKFGAFVERFPGVADLANAAQSEVLRMWRGLGYNSRAIRLHGVARAIVAEHGGSVPSDTRALLALPGIGRYTAAAVRAFAFDIDDAPVDTNVRRIVHRLRFGIEHPSRANDRDLDRAARSIAPSGNAHDWNSAMMDLGASICTARAPKCLRCPLRTCCAAAPIDAAELDAARRATARKRSPQNLLPFEKTTRYVRGRIVDRLRELPAGRRISLLDLHESLRPLVERSLDELRASIDALQRDGLVTCVEDLIALRD